MMNQNDTVNNNISCISGATEQYNKARWNALGESPLLAHYKARMRLF